MSEKKELTDEPPVIRFTGIFDFEDLYKTLTGWFGDNGFDMHEKKYVHKGKEQEFEWIADKKVTSYYQYDIEVSMFIWDLKKVEVVKDGEKVKMDSGRIQLIVKGYYTLDYDKYWTGGFTETLRGIYHKFIIDKDIILKVYTPLYRYVYDYYDKARESLGMVHT